MSLEVSALEVSSDGASVTDAIGVQHPVAANDPKIVSLVPSITELLCDLGLADHIVARTGFCVHPKDVVRRIPKVGGTKDVDVGRLRDLQPTHAVVNVDENRKGLYDELTQFIEHVFVTHPLEPRDNIALYRALGVLFGRQREAGELVEAFERALSALGEAGSHPRNNVLYLIWKDPWMAVGPSTYIAEMLKLINWHVSAAASGGRYPEVDLVEFVGRVDRVLLSSEPYRFRDKHVREVAEIFRDGTPVQLVDGEMCSWFGSRAIAGVEYLQSLARAA